MKANTMEYCLELEVQLDKQTRSSFPLRVHLDFDKALKSLGVKGLIDPHTLFVIRKRKGRTKKYEVAFDEKLYTGNQGWVAWRCGDLKADDEWALEFSLREKTGLLKPVPYKPMVGVGDEIHYNGKRWNPIAVPGMHQFPIPVDWNGDGLVGIISTSHYSNTQGMPWAGIFYWRNIGSNEKPRFAPPIRLYAEGVEQADPSKTRWSSKWTFKGRRDYISEYYIRCDIVDWFGKGRMDLVTASMSGGIRIYRNTGKLDSVGLPKLELAVKISLPKHLPPTGYLSIRAIHWEDDVLPSFLIGAPTGLGLGHIWLMRNVSTDKAKPKFKTFPLPRSNFWGAVKKTKINSWSDVDNFPNWRAFSIDYFDVDNDGKKELLVQHGGRNPYPSIEVWRNAGTADKPCMMQDGHLPWSDYEHYFGFRFVCNAAFDGCLIAGFNSGTGMHYFKRKKSDPFAIDSYKDMGPLLGEGSKLKIEGYVKPNPIDFEGNGKMDIVCGDEAGYVTLVKHIGSKNKPAFGILRKLTDRKGNILHLCRENILHDNDHEKICGHLKPVICDWDQDGKLDIIVGNNTNRIFWLQDYNPKKNNFRKMHQLKVKGILDPFAWRKGPAVLEIGNKTCLIAIDSQDRFGLYRQCKKKDKGIFLEPPVHLKFTTGKTITSRDITLASYKHSPAISIAVADWTGNGAFDLLVSSNFHTFLLENVGTNQNPKFKKPLPFSTPDGIIEISRHDTHVAVYDWDNDGRLDLMIGGESGSIYLFHRDWLCRTQNHKIILRCKTDNG